MSRTIMLIPTGTSGGLTSVSLGVIRAMERKGVRLSVFNPIAQPRAGGDAPDQTTTHHSRELRPSGRRAVENEPR